jgi:hypothetical protein
MIQATVVTLRSVLTSVVQIFLQWIKGNLPHPLSVFLTFLPLLNLLRLQSTQECWLIVSPQLLSLCVMHVRFLCQGFQLFGYMTQNLLLLLEHHL